MKKLTAILLSFLILSVTFVVPASAITAPAGLTEYIRGHMDEMNRVADISSFSEKYGWTVDDSKKYLEAVFYSLPQMFFVDNEDITIRYDHYSGMPLYYVFSYTMTKAQREKAAAKIDNVVSKILEGITDDMSDTEKALYVHDYLILNCSYDFKGSGRNIYSCLVNRIAKCQGYALAYEYILNDILGIECTTVISDSQNHIWNYVKIGNKWYHVDVTCDDPLVIYGQNGYDRYGLVGHDNFLISDELCKTTNGLHRDWYIVGDKPAASDKRFDNAFWRGVLSKINIVDGDYYYVSKGSSDSTGKIVNVCRYDPDTGKNKILVKLKCKWYVTRMTTGETYNYGTSSYNTVLASLEYSDGKLYFNSNKSVYSYNISTKKYKKIYTLNKGDEQQIFGMVMTDGKLRLAYKKDQTYAEKYLKLVLK